MSLERKTHFPPLIANTFWRDAITFHAAFPYLWCFQHCNWLYALVCLVSSFDSSLCGSHNAPSELNKPQLLAVLAAAGTAQRDYPGLRDPILRQGRGRWWTPLCVFGVMLKAGFIWTVPFHPIKRKELLKPSLFMCFESWKMFLNTSIFHSTTPNIDDPTVFAVSLKYSSNY